jgi:hypothetical protein
MKISIGTAGPKPKEGLRDGGHVYPRCTNCNAILMDLWVNRPHETDVWKVRCNCPFCDERPESASLGGSFTVEVKGGFASGGYGVRKVDDETDEIVSTIADSWELEGDTFVFKVIKANKNARPLYHEPN